MALIAGRNTENESQRSIKDGKVQKPVVMNAKTCENLKEFE
jgi:hypothetical protein